MIPTLVYASYMSPFPTNAGDRIRILNLITALRALGYRVEAFVGNIDCADLAAHSREGVNFRRIPFEQPRLRQAMDVYFRPHGEFIRQIEALHRLSPLTAVVLDYGYMGAQIAPIAALGIPVVLGTHNVESALTGQTPKASAGGKAAIKLRQGVEFAHERFFFSRADALICVSQEDRKVYEQFVPADRLHIIPNFVDVPDTFGDVERPNRVVMSGSFDNFQNCEGLRWFVEQVWDEELRAITELHVVGKRSDEAARQFQHVPGILGLGAKDDLLKEIGSSRCSIVPLRLGGGSRIKCIEAMAVRTPVVSTTKGCEGIIHGGAFWVADQPKAFKQAILDVLSDGAQARRRAAAGRATFDRLYSLPANVAGLRQVLSSAARAKSGRTVEQYAPDV